MVDLNPYGRKGCSCWPPDHGDVNWQANAGCRYHGLLADYQPPRQDTGVYTLDLKRYEEELPGGPPEECEFEGMYGEHEHIDNGFGERVCLAGPVHTTTEHEETGAPVRATHPVRRWARRLADAFRRR